MEVTTSADYRDEQLVFLDDLKFVMFDLDGERRIVLSNAGRDHIKQLPTNGKLVGAGLVYKDGKVEWGSSTCRQARGYDRPGDVEEALRIVEEVRSAIEAWKSKYR